MKVENEKLDTMPRAKPKEGKDKPKKDKTEKERIKEIREALEAEGNAVKASKVRPGRLPRLTKEEQK
jgi:hypothetical protein